MPFDPITNPARARAFDRAVARFAAHQPGVSEALDEALAQDPSDAAALAFAGLCQVLLARRETMEAARSQHAQAIDALAETPAPRARSLVEALGLAVEGRLRQAAGRLEQRIADAQHDFLAFKLAHALRFMAGDAQGMLTASTRLLPAWNSALPHYGYLLGCHAFALGENGRLAEAETFGRRAVEHAPDDAWGVHAVAHVHETRGETRQGIDWLEQTRLIWKSCNNFAFHMAWHLALFRVARGEFAEALRLYDEEVRPVPTDDFRDVANATSLLWRLEQGGCSVGRRWDELHEIARRRADDATLVFASLHHLLTCLARDDRDGAARVVASIEGLSQMDGLDQAGVAASVGSPLAAALASLPTRTTRRFDIAAILARLPLLGGSRAQRDVFQRTLLSIAARAEFASAIHRVA